MTTIAMVAGMLPLVIGLGHADNSFRAPMAAAVIGGLITSTVLSLLVTPSFFTLVDDIPAAFAWLKQKLTGRKSKTVAKDIATDTAKDKAQDSLIVTTK
jgi:hypothetical protein